MPLTDMFSPLAAPGLAQYPLTDPGGGQGVGGILNAFSDMGFYDPALGPLFTAAGQGDPAAQEQLKQTLASQGVQPPATPGASASGGIGAALKGIQAPTAPESMVPRIGVAEPPPPRPSGSLGGGSELNILSQLIRQASGEVPIMSLLSRVPH